VTIFFFHCKALSEDAALWLKDEKGRNGSSELRTLEGKVSRIEFTLLKGYSGIEKNFFLTPHRVLSMRYLIYPNPLINFRREKQAPSLKYPERKTR